MRFNIMCVGWTLLGTAVSRQSARVAAPTDFQDLTFASDATRRCVSKRFDP